MFRAKSQATAIALLTAMSTGRRSAMQSPLQCMDLSTPPSETAMKPNAPCKWLNQPTRGSFAVNTTVKPRRLYGVIYIYGKRIHLSSDVSVEIFVLLVACTKALCLHLLEEQ